MRLSLTRSATPVRAMVAATAAVMIAILTTAQPAWAHARLLSTDPADGATVTTLVPAVTFTFSAPMREQFSTVVVTGADGTAYAEGKPRAVDATLVQAVRPLPPGPVRVAWRAVSADGDPVEGQFTFTNAASVVTSAPVSAATPAAPTTSVVAASGADHRGLRWFGGAAGVAIAVLVALLVVYARRRRDQNSIR